MKNRNIIVLTDCLLGLQEMPSASVDCCVTDPPYGIHFMAKQWDYEVLAAAVWREVLRVLKPGAHLLCACGTRSQHKMAGNIELAGFEIRDVLCWHYGQGLTKSMDLSKALTRSKTHQQKQIQRNGAKDKGSNRKKPTTIQRKKPPSMGKIIEKMDIERWKGWGTGLKPATEFWTLARKPISEKTMAENMLKYGTGGLNIDAARIDPQGRKKGGNKAISLKSNQAGLFDKKEADPVREHKLPLGRFPANAIFDEFMADELDRQSGWLQSGKPSGVRKAKNNVYGQYAPGQPLTGYGDTGGASRFFYVAKASPSDRGEGNNHPTVKPLTLMRYLIRLVCPEERGRIVLDPYAGSGSTCLAARQIGLDFVAFECEKRYVTIANRRLKKEN